jgi:hypothetical protein
MPGFLKVRPLIILLLELGDQLIHKFNLEGLSGRVPEHELRGERHRRPECGKLLSHLSMADGSDLHPL